MIRTVTDPSGSTAVPRLLSTNSPWRCSVVGSMTSTLLEGCIASMTPLKTMIAIMTTSIAAMIMNQRFSVRATTSSGTMPSGSGRRCGYEDCSPNRASRHEQEKIEHQPSDEQKPDTDAGDDVRANRSVTERLRRLVRAGRLIDGTRRMRGGLFWL